MDYISSQQFLAEDEIVQKKLKEWWRQSNGYSLTPSEWVGGNNIPLFTETQLRHFIEDNTRFNLCSINIDYIGSEGQYKFDIHLMKVQFNQATQEFEPDYCGYTVKQNKHDLLQVYWKVACTVASE